MAYKNIGRTVAEWEDSEPFIFTLRESTEPEYTSVMHSIAIDLSPLRAGFKNSFLLNLKEHLIGCRDRLALISVRTEAKALVLLFQKVIELGVFDEKIGVIDERFLLCLATVQEHLPYSYMDTLSRHFSATPSSKIFANGLQKSDFPRASYKRGRHGGQIDRILSKALSQVAVANILDQCDNAFATGKLDIGHYSFAHLAFAVFCRPNSYRQIRVCDLHVDPKSKNYIIQIITSKSGEDKPSKTSFSLNEPLGILLTKQRQNVVETYGHLVGPECIDKLALFPARRLNQDKSRWCNEYANQSLGMYKDSGSFAQGYGQAIMKSLVSDASLTLNANVLRHTVGTLLAQAGASAKTIQAVLRHASDTVCAAYVDIAFYGLIEELSEAMRPAFESHLPGFLNFRSQADPIEPEKKIWSEDIVTGQIEDTGECGKSIACENAPIVCYSCFRFRPCWDADHSISLQIVQREILDMEKRGKPFEHMLQRARTARNHIVIVMNAADRYRDYTRSQETA